MNEILYNKQYYLPLIEYTEGFFPENHLNNVFVISCQHILPSTHMMFRSMIRLGLNPKNLAVIGKCYSTNNEVMNNLRKEDIYVCDSSNIFNSDLSFDEQFKKSITLFLESQLQRMAPKQNDTIIILDDGGELLTAAQSLKSKYPNIFGVEQTTSGYHKLAYVNMSFPVKNVALSKAKLDFESPLIAKSILKNLDHKISISELTSKEILIVGNGSIGNEIKKLLATDLYKHHNIVSYDVIHEKTDIEYLDFSNFDIIIGATGTRMMIHNYYDTLKNGATLVSVSSSDREFDAVHFRKLSKKIYNTHDDITYKNIKLLNCGFPLNFSGEDSVSVPLHKIQLVCALLMLGVCELAKCDTKQKDFVQLNKDLAQRITNQFIKSCAEQ